MKRKSDPTWYRVRVDAATGRVLSARRVEVARQDGECVVYVQAESEEAAKAIVERRRHRAQQRERKERRLARGQCIQCGVPARGKGSTATRCPLHAEESRASVRRCYERRNAIRDGRPEDAPPPRKRGGKSRDEWLGELRPVIRVEVLQEVAAAWRQGADAFARWLVAQLRGTTVEPQASKEPEKAEASPQSEALTIITAEAARAVGVPLPVVTRCPPPSEVPHEVPCDHCGRLVKRWELIGHRQVCGRAKSRRAS